MDIIGQPAVVSINPNNTFQVRFDIFSAPAGGTVSPRGGGT